MGVLVRSVRIVELKNSGGGPLAFFEVEIDGAWVVKDIRLVKMDGGDLKIFMPYRKYKFACLSCGSKEEYNHKFCSECGKLLPPRERRVFERPSGEGGLERWWADIFYPATMASRQEMESACLKAYEKACQTTQKS